MQGITNERLRLRAIAFTSSCERVCVRVRPRSHPRVNACAFASACERDRVRVRPHSPPRVQVSRVCKRVYVITGLTGRGQLSKENYVIVIT